MKGIGPAFNSFHDYVIVNNVYASRELLLRSTSVGEELYTQTVFLFSQFWQIDIFFVVGWRLCVIVEVCEWYH